MQHWQCALLLSGCFVGLLWLWLRYARISEQSSRALLQISETSHRQPERNRMLPVLVYSVCCLVATLVSAASPISMIADNGLVLLMAAALSEGFVLPALAAFAAFALMVSPFEGVCLAVPVIWSAYQSFTAKACLSVNLSEGDVEHVATAGGRARLPLSANQDGKTVSEPPRHSFGATVLKSICYGVLCVAFALVSEVGRSDRVWQGRFPTHFPALSAGLREVYSFAAAVLAPLRQGRVFEAVIAALLHMRPASVDAASLQPELSLMWYVGSAAFSRHLPYYAAIFAGHALLYPLPATFRLRRRPDLAIVLVAGLAALLNPTSRWSLARMPLVVCLALSHSAVIARESWTGRRQCLYAPALSQLQSRIRAAIRT